MLLHHQFEKTAQQRPDKVALVTRVGRYTYGNLAHMAARLASALQNSGVEHGDRVAIFLNNGLEAVVSIYATSQLGAVFLPLSPQIKAEKLAYVLSDAGPKCVITEDRLVGVFQKAIRRNSSVDTCVIVGAIPETGCGKPKFLSFSHIVSASHGALSTPKTIDQDLAAIIYTSGSSGEPKGVMLTHLNMITAANSVSSYLGLRPSDVTLCVLPLSFDYGLYQILMGHKIGATVVLEQSFAFPMTVLQIMEQERVTVFPGVPTMFSMLRGSELVSRFDLTSLRMITNTAAALSESHIKDLRRLFPDAALFSMYGLTECKRVSYLPPEELDRRPTSVGRGMPNQEVFLVDEDGNRLPNGNTGELVVRGSHVMRGYWKKPEETAKCLKLGPIGSELLLYTGDVFRTDEDGYLYFVGRKDDIIKSRGEKVSPKEVENQLYKIEGVQEAAVIGVPDPLLGQAIKAFLVLKPGYDYSEKNIVKYCLSAMENYMVPKYVEFIANLPRTNTGKIAKQQLK